MKRLKYFALAALVAFAACEEGNEILAPATGTISGTVTVDGQGLQGVTVTLSPTGATTTTAANGDYSFSGVEAGAYTVSISGTPSDAAFGTTSQATTISSAGQANDVDFSGSYIRTSAITASVSVPGVGAIAGATVSISGMQSSSQVTGPSGTANFSGLRAGAYTVSAVLGASAAALYDLDVASFNVDLDVDELEVVTFTATPKTISTITGRMYIDEATKNNQFDPGNEENLTIADVDVIIEGVSVGVFDTIQTDANGEYELSGLPAANYRITLDTSPFNGAVALGTQNDIVISLGVADTEVVDFGFDIIEQRIAIGGFTGCDEDEPGITGNCSSNTVDSRVQPIPGLEIALYTTTQSAELFLASDELGEEDTGSDGFAWITFDRADDTDPFGGPSDNIVFARVTGGAFPLQNGENIIEIPFPATDSLATSADVFDYLNTGPIVVSFMNQEIDGDTYDEINVFGYADTTVAPAIFNQDTNADGMVFFTLPGTGNYFFHTSPNNWGVFSDPAIPNPPDGIDPNPTFTETFEEAAGTTAGSYLRYAYTGTALPGDTVFIGKGNIAWDEVIVRGRVFREFNEMLGYQSGVGGDVYGLPVGNARVYLERDDNGTWVTDASDDADPAFNGAFSFNMVPVGPTYRLRGTSDAAAAPMNWAILNETLVDVVADGSDQLTEPCPLQTEGTTAFANCGTFAIKGQNNTLAGTVFYRDGTPVPNGTPIRVVVADSTIQGRFLDEDGNESTDAVFETSAGLFAVTGVREGYYHVEPLDDGPEVLFFPAPLNGDPKDAEVRGQGIVATVPQTTADGAIAAESFHAFRADGSVNGVVVNDRDADENVIDNNEALIGATVSLFAGEDGPIPEGALIETQTIGANGSYSFQNLLTMEYLVVAEAPAGSVVIANGNTDPEYTVTVRASQPSGDPDLDINVPAPTMLPRWDYENDVVINAAEDVTEQDSYFTFLYADGTVSGVVINDEDDSPAQSVTIQLVRCQTYGAPIPVDPVYGDCTDNGGVNAAGTFQSTLTAANGTYSFTGLREGIYQVNIVSNSGSDADGPFLPGLTVANSLAGTGESVVLFVDGPTDLEAVDYLVNN